MVNYPIPDLDGVFHALADPTRRAIIGALYAPIGSAHTVSGSHHHGIINFALLYRAARNRILDTDLDNIANRRITTL